MRDLKKIILAVTIVFSSVSVFGDIIFEGYYKVLSQNKQIGFAVQSYEYDPALKQFKSVYYVKVKSGKRGVSESLVALSDNKFHPISYQYTAQSGKTVRTVDAKFIKKRKNYQMQATIFDGKNTRTVTKKLAKGSFLSTFLLYLMLQKGYDVNTKFNYIGIAEEDAEAYNGQAYVKELTDFQGKKVHKILYQFKGVKFYSYSTLTGEVAYSHSPVQKIATQLVKSPAEATVGMVLNTKIVKKLFGRVPLGNKNYLNKPVVKKQEPKKKTIVESKAKLNKPVEEAKETPKVKNDVQRSKKESPKDK
ncbi:hypothetical protein N9W41_00450 [bacterium]|nr:hypothetical protein [bacterium]